MIRDSRTVTLAVIVLASAVISSGATVATTHAYFSDTETATGSISAATDFGTGTPPNDAVAWNDADGDGEYDQGEQTYTSSDFKQSGGGTIDYSGKNIVTNQKLSFRLNGNGNINLANVRIESEKSISIRTNGGDINLKNAELIAKSKIKITSKGGTIMLDGATCTPEADITGNTVGQSTCT